MSNFCKDKTTVSSGFVTGITMPMDGGFRTTSGI
jgi:hypothetical protein